MPSKAEGITPIALLRFTMPFLKTANIGICSCFILLDFLEILSDGVCVMANNEEFGKCSDPLFEWINAECERIKNDSSMSEVEKDLRETELAQLHGLSDPVRYSDYMHQNFLNRIKAGKSFYNKLPLVHHKTSSTVK